MCPAQLPLTHALCQVDRAAELIRDGEGGGQDSGYGGGYVRGGGVSGGRVGHGGGGGGGRDAGTCALWVLPLYASLPTRDQMRVFDRPARGTRKVWARPYG